MRFRVVELVETPSRGLRSEMKNSDRGATMVEAAIVVVLILTMIFGLVELGRYVATTSTVTNASREAARYASGTGEGVNPPTKRFADCAGMRTSAQQFGVIAQPSDSQITLRYLQADGTLIEICAGSTISDPGLVATGDRIEATVSIPYSPVTPLVNIFIPSGNISATTSRTFNLGP